MRFVILIATLLAFTSASAQIQNPIRRTSDRTPVIDDRVTIRSFLQLPKASTPTLNGSGDSTGAFLYVESPVDTSVYVRVPNPDGIGNVWRKLGERGPAGTNGINGTDGAPGTPGTNGSNGTNGADGVSVVNITKSVTGDTLYIHLSNGSTSTITGVKGDPGSGVNILGSFSDPSQLPPTGNPGDAYLIAGDLYVWSTNTNTWENVGNIQGPSGTPGTPGSVTYYGTSTPAVGLGVNGDVYIDTATKTWYKKEGGVWNVVVVATGGSSSGDGIIIYAF